MATNPPEGPSPHHGEVTPHPGGEVVPPPEAPPPTAAQWYAFQYAGAVPLPEMARGWAELVPDAPERMMQMAEREQEHRHSLDRSYVTYRFIAQAGAFVLGAVALIGGLLLIAAGESPYGLAAFLGALVAFVAVILVRQFVGARVDANNGV